jgi:hypothetical protein
VGHELIHVDRRPDGRTDRETDMTKLIVAFRNFANAFKNCETAQHIVIDIRLAKLYSKEGHDRTNIL